MSQRKNGRFARKNGFRMASQLLQTRIRQAGESRGFAVSRLLTQWAEIVGEETARISVPVKVGYSKGGLGATLTILVKGANAVLLQAELPKIQERVNSCYGYAAISRVRITQTAATGFSEGAIAFEGASPKPPTKVSKKKSARVKKDVAGVADGSLRAALEALGENVLSRPKK
ncbi:MAG: DUF721 domain-containing protein [Marinosulfonomonas sp.]|nr:DUF721 domain-containing protein [Marinosulfonomonas sp.]